MNLSPKTIVIAIFGILAAIILLIGRHNTRAREEFEIAEQCQAQCEP